MKIYLRHIKPFTFFLFIFLIASNSLQAQRSVSASKSFSDYRPVGETRVWTFLMKDSIIGQLLSTVEKETEIDGEFGYALDDRIYLDYGKIGNPVIIDVSGWHFVSNDGTYLGDDLKLIVNTQEERLKFEKEDNEITGYVTRFGEEVDFKITYPENRFAIDNNFMDHYESYLAMKDIKVGDTFSDSIFMPQTGLMGVIEGEVVGFSWQQLHRTLFDSVFVIKLTSPQNMEMFFSPDKKLLKVNIHSLEMRIYLDAVQQRPKPKSDIALFTFDSFIKLIPNYIIFIITSFIIALLFGSNKIFSRTSLFSFILGVISVSIVVWIQLPIQNALFNQWYAPSITSGEASYFVGLLTTVPAGIIQEGLKIISILFLLTILKCKKEESALIGTLFGAGLGVASAVYLISIVPPLEIFTWGLMERLSWILFHIVSGTLIGWAYFSGKSKLIITLMITMGINIILRSLPYLSPANILSIEIIFILNAVVVLVLLLISLFIVKKQSYK